jgi:hypothetical protein
MLLNNIARKLDPERWRPAPPRPTCAPPARCELLQELTRIHEAAHATLAFLLGRPVSDVTVFADGGGEFRSYPRSADRGAVDQEAAADAILAGARSSSESRALWFDQLVTRAAGRAAAHRFGATNPVYDRGSDSDFALIRKVARALCGTPAEADDYVREIERAAAHLVAEHWPAIKSVAKALRRTGHLDKVGIAAAIAMVEPKKMARHEPSDVALHEAGHATADIAAGIGIESVTADRHSGRGFVRMAADQPRGDHGPWHMAVAHLTGPVAEHLFGAGPSPSHDHDMAHARQAAAHLLGLPIGLGTSDPQGVAEVLREVRSAACGFVSRNQDAIMRLAGALDQRGSIDGAQCRAIVGAVTPISPRPHFRLRRYASGVAGTACERKSPGVNPG